MALQSNSGTGLPLWGFVTITFLQGWIVSPAPNPQPKGPGLRIYDPGDRVAQVYPQALGTHFSRLLRYTWVTEGLLFNPGFFTDVQLNVRDFPIIMSISGSHVTHAYFLPCPFYHPSTLNP
jgi:hypothetical protein